MPTPLDEAADAFYAAGNRLLSGEASAFETIWSQADDISLLGPTGGIHTGREAVMQQFARESAMGFEGTLESTERRFLEGPGMALMVHIQRTSGMTRDGEAISHDIRATTVFRQESGHWRVVHHHTDRF